MMTKWCALLARSAHRAAGIERAALSRAFDGRDADWHHGASRDPAATRSGGPGSCVVHRGHPGPRQFGSIPALPAAAGLEEVYLSEHAVQGVVPARAARRAWESIRVAEYERVIAGASARLFRDRPCRVKGWRRAGLCGGFARSGRFRFRQRRRRLERFAQKPYHGTMPYRMSDGVEC